MSGLLDKATEYSDSVHQGDNVGSKVVNDPSAIIGAYEMGKKSAETCLLYTSPSPRDLSTSRMPSSA